MRSIPPAVQSILDAMKADASPRFCVGLKPASQVRAEALDNLRSLGRYRTKPFKVGPALQDYLRG